MKNLIQFFHKHWFKTHQLSQLLKRDIIFDTKLLAEFEIKSNNTFTNEIKKLSFLLTTKRKFSKKNISLIKKTRKNNAKKCATFFNKIFNYIYIALY